MTNSVSLDHWVAEKVFATNLCNKKSKQRIATMASKVLEIEVSEEDINMAIESVRRQKNFDLELYPFSDDQDLVT